MIKLFKDKETEAERDFMTIINIVKKYDKSGFTKLMGAVGKVWEGYDDILRTKTRQEKEDDKQAKEDKDITDAEDALIEIKNKEK